MSVQTRILIVDDDENIIKTIATILKDQDYSIDTATTGREAISKTQKNLYDLMLIDIRLPDMEGVDLLNKINDTVPKIRKIIMTGFPTLQNAVTAVNTGADAYIIKPFNVEKMLAVIKEQIEKQKQERAFSEERVAMFIATRIRESE
jgi:two-component system, NtrC family, response regulator